MGILDAELARIEKMVVGLGNPGQDYARTRHNLGFRALDAFVKTEGYLKSFDSHGKSRIQIVTIDQHPVLLVKPSTYMNLSGQAVFSLLGATGLSVSELLVVHDEMDLPQGRAKMKIGGKPAGHKGIADIVERCGEQFTRIKIGIGRPEDDADDAGIDWVLGEPGMAEEESYMMLFPTVATAIRRWIIDGPEKAMTWFNSEMRIESEASDPDGEELISSMDFEPTSLDHDGTD
jgi:peptidyl-tRNA hydrolase, PTH1 family